MACVPLQQGRGTALILGGRGAGDAVVGHSDGDRADGAISRRLKVQLTGADEVQKGGFAVDRDTGAVHESRKTFIRVPTASGTRGEIGPLNHYPTS